MRLDLYFKAIRGNIHKDYMVFFHNEGNLKQKRTKSDTDLAMGEYPTTYWKKGDIIRQPMTVHIPGNNPNSSYTVYGGLFQEDYRANITNHESVKNDGDNRLIIVKLELSK